MTTRIAEKSGRVIMLSAMLVLLAGVAVAQTAQDALPPGVVSVEPTAESAVAYSSEELAELVGPIALYPDDLVAIVLPASTYPLQLVQAARFLDSLENNPSLKPDPEWDESVVALLNYPEVIRLLNDDLDWAWHLGEAVLAQQADVIEAIEQFRDRAWLAGNLRSDERQNVSREEGVVRIIPADPEVIYVPYYEPRRVVYYSPLPVYHYYPRAYPSYYYPYPVGYGFSSGFFWGVTSAFAIGWNTHFIHVHHYGFPNHPYYGRRYYDRYYYRRPVVRNDYRRPPHRDRGPRLHAGNRWRSAYRPGARPHRVRAGGSAGPDGPRNRVRARNPALDGRQPRLARPAGESGRGRAAGTRTAAGNRGPGARNQLVARDQLRRANPAAGATNRANRPSVNTPRNPGARSGERVRGDAALQQRQARASRLASGAGSRGNSNRPAATQPGTRQQVSRGSANRAQTGRGLALNQVPRGVSPPATSAPRSKRAPRAPTQRLAPAPKRFAAPASGRTRAEPAGRPASRLSASGQSNQRRATRAVASRPRMAAPRVKQQPQRIGRAAPAPPAAAPGRSAESAAGRHVARQSSRPAQARGRPARQSNAGPRRNR